jgi:hypothetical protein
VESWKSGSPILATYPTQTTQQKPSVSNEFDNSTDITDATVTRMSFWTRY